MFQEIVDILSINETGEAESTWFRLSPGVVELAITLARQTGLALAGPNLSDTDHYVVGVGASLDGKMQVFSSIEADQSSWEFIGVIPNVVPFWPPGEHGDAQEVYDGLTGSDPDYYASIKPRYGTSQEVAEWREKVVALLRA